MESESSFADAFLGRIFDIFGLLLGRKVRSGRILFVGDNGRDDDILNTEDIPALVFQTSGLRLLNQISTPASDPWLQ